MTNLDEQITNVLNHHAADTPVEDNLDVILSDGHLVRFSAGVDDPARSTPRLLVAAATVVIVAAGAIGIVRLSGNDNPPESSAGDEAPPAPTAEAADPTPGRAFPVLGPVPEIDAAIYGTFVSHVAPYTTSAVLARRDGDRLVDVAAVYAVVADPSDETQLVPPDADITNGTLGVGDVDVDVDVTVYENPGGRWYRWIDGRVTLLLQASTDSEAIAGSVSVSADPSTGLVDLVFGDLPSGLEMISVPRPQIGAQPALSTDDAQLDLVASTALAFGDGETTDGYDIVDINGREGFATALEEGSMVTWRVDDDTWMRLSASAIGTDRTIEIARDVTYVDQSAWERIHDTDFPTSPVPPPTTQP